VNVRFDGPVPGQLRRCGQVCGVTGDELRVATSDPPATLARLLAAGAAPVSIDVSRPGLDDLYAALIRDSAPASAALPG
jgi:hypothetical protein